ncbi:glycosyltransferase family 2 protein [Luteimonas sp. MJ293]|uniref:glycosyltransferase family 2 protein n=1 Tax=Luteimonas sp. MJ146 TaxID=3129240 RepID=UPI0031BA29CC
MQLPDFKSVVPVSVIIPCYECSDTIVRAVDSIKHQSVLPLEVILVDDASPSLANKEALASLAASNPGWIKLTALRENRGPGTARNVGWEQARGEYIAFLDADDVWHPSKLQVQYQWMENNPEITLSSHPSVTLSPSRPLAFPRLPDRIAAREVAAKSQYLRNQHATRCVMVRRTVDARFKAGKRHAEDYHLWAEIGLRGGKMAILNASLAGSFRPPFSKGGLSGQLWSMQRGGWGAQLDLYRSGYVSIGLFGCAVSFGALRFARRLAVSAYGRMGG